MRPIGDTKGRGRALWRTVTLALALLPVALGLAAPYMPAGSMLRLWLAAVLAASLLGRLLSRLRFLPPWLLAGVVLAAGLAASIAWRPEWSVPAGYLGVAWFAGSLAPSRTAVALTGIAANAIALIAAQWASGLAPYRTLWLLAGIVWFAELLYALHGSLLASAGLEGGIVTRLVSRASRRYATGLLAAVLIAYLATSDFHLWRELVRFLNEHMPHFSSGQPEQTPEAAPPVPPPMLPTEPPGKPGLATRILNIVMYVFAGAIVAGLLALLVRRFLLNREWLRSVWERTRSLAVRLFRRKEAPEAPSFTDEKESLLDIGRALRQAQDRWRRRRRKPLTRQEWEALPAADKVRRLYRDSLEAAVGRGHVLRPSDAPEEALGALEAWYEGREREGGGRSAPAVWLRRTRGTLLVLYWRTRYGQWEPTPAELAELAADYPWGERK